jgi:hypothetical protein
MIRDFTNGPIIDPNHNAPISVEAAHPHSGAKGKCPVRGGQLASPSFRVRRDSGANRFWIG